MARQRNNLHNRAQLRESTPSLKTDVLFTCIPGRHGTTAVVVDLFIANPMAKSNQRSDNDHSAPLTVAQIREEELEAAEV